MDNSDDKKDDTTPQKKELPSGLQKICLVCGDKALGYNFNAISCESCKAFFRRNALASKEFKCPFTNNCVITVVTRRFCQKCRLEKCLSIGMVKEFIMSEEDKAEKRRKIEENRARKRQLRDPDDAVTSSKSLKRDDEGDTTYNVPLQDSVIQYDNLSTTCSPSSTTVQSPMSNNDLESSLPGYQFPPNVAPVHEAQSNDTQYQSSDSQYTMKVYPIDEKSVINRAIYAQRMISSMETYNLYENVDSNLYAEPPKENTIRFVTFHKPYLIYKSSY